MTNKTKSILSSKLYNILQKINHQRHLYSIRVSFLSIMPIMLVGAYAVVINNLPISQYQNYMEVVFGQGWKDFGGLIFNSTIQITSLVLIFTIGVNLSKWYNDNRKINVHPNICGMVGLTSYMIMNLDINGTSIAFFDTGVTGIFSTILIGIISCEIFIRIYNIKMFSFYVNYDPDIEVPTAFISIIPSLFVIFGFAILRQLIIYAGINDGINNIINQILSMPYKFTIPTIKSTLIYNISTHLMWIFGIHGNNVLDIVAKGFFEGQGNLISKTFLDAFVYLGGSGATLGLLISLYIFSKNKSYKSLFRYALPNSIFNVNEPLIFGIPIVLNPIYLIPFILTPCVLFFTTYFGISMGIVPPIIEQVNWATPIVISGYISTGSVMGSLLQIFNLFIATLIYAPFVKISEQLSEIQFKDTYDELVRLVIGDYSASKGLLQRSDRLGAVARQLSNDMDNAIEKGELFLNYQPVVNVNEKKLYGMEALLRWEHPVYGMINPMLIIAIAEENQLIHKLGLWIMDRAIGQRSQWTKEDLPDFKIAVNISTHQLNNSNFYEEVLNLLTKHRVPSRQLNIEITESVALIENADTTNNIYNLSKSGVEIVMDDFGVGHSSLIYLRNMPIKVLKIDQSLSREISNGSYALSIISTIYDLCINMGIRVVVEYVETEEQLNNLMEIGDFLIQGYLFSPPINPEEAIDFIGEFHN